jgi:hypothetical protein
MGAGRTRDVPLSRRSHPNVSSKTLPHHGTADAFRVVFDDLSHWSPFPVDPETTLTAWRRACRVQFQLVFLLHIVRQIRTNCG